MKIYVGSSNWLLSKCILCDVAADNFLISSTMEHEKKKAKNVWHSVEGVLGLL